VGGDRPRATRRVRSGEARVVTRTSSFILLAALLLLAACGLQTVQTFSSEQGGSDANFVTFEYPFTDAGAEEARKRAERQCGQKKSVAVKLRSACSLSRCTTSYQCMAPADAPGYQTGEGAK